MLAGAVRHAGLKRATLTGMIIILLSFAVCLVGAFVYALSTTPKPMRLGEIMFACGLLATLLHLSSQTLAFLR